MKSITQNNENDKKFSSSIIKFFKTYKVFSILKASNAYASSGDVVSTVSKFL